jgi:hypothetical protein
MKKNKKRVLEGFKDTSPRIPLKFSIIKYPCQVNILTAEFSTALIWTIIFFLILVPLNSLAVMESESYKIKYEAISSGEGPEQSDNYKLLESIGETGASQDRSENYLIGGGQAFGIMSNVPPAPTLLNDGSPSYYNKLHFTINPGNNPSDTLFVIAITDDDWVNTRYIQDNNSVGDVLGSEDWQTYTNWGGASGELVTGLEAEKTYKIKVIARQGNFTMTGWGPESSEASTSVLSLSFSISTDALDFGTLSPSDISTINYIVNSSTNGEWGYVTTIVEDGDLRIEGGHEIYDVTDGEVDAGHEEYGIRTSGSEGQMNGQDYAITSAAQTIAMFAGPISNSQTTANHKVSIEPSTPSGQYYQIITLICTSIF